MKKILFVVDSLEVGGIEKSLINLLKYLTGLNKYEITLLSLVSDGPLEKEVPNNIKRIKIKWEKQKYLKPIRKELKNFNFIYILNLLKYKKKVGILPTGESIRYNVIKSLDKIKEYFDIAIAYTDSSSLFYVGEKVEADKKYVWVHMDYTEKNNRPISHNVFYEKMDKIICVSKKAQESFGILNSKLKDKTCVIHNLLDTTRIDVLSKKKCNEFDENYFNILSVGRLSKEKNFETLIQSFSELKRQLEKKIRLYIIGDGIEYDKLKSIIKDEDLQEDCFLIGSKENPYKYMKNCDLYVQVSIREGFGMTLYEAFYLKKPVLSTRVSITDELFTNGYNALIVENNINDITKGLYKLITKDDLRKRLTDNITNNVIISDEKVLINLLNGEKNEKN